MSSEEVRRAALKRPLDMVMHTPNNFAKRPKIASPEIIEAATSNRSSDKSESSTSPSLPPVPKKKIRLTRRELNVGAKTERTLRRRLMKLSINNNNQEQSPKVQHLSDSSYKDCTPDGKDRRINDILKEQQFYMKYDDSASEDYHSDSSDTEAATAIRQRIWKLILGVDKRTMLQHRISWARWNGRKPRKPLPTMWVIQGQQNNMKSSMSSASEEGPSTQIKRQMGNYNKN